MANNYSGSDILHMQQDAIRRVREMQRRANEKLRQGNSPPSNGTTPPPLSLSNSHPSSSHNERPVPISTNPPVQDSLAGVLDRLGIDNEKAVLLLLIILMLNEGADTKLILALCYLLI